LSLLFYCWPGIAVMGVPSADEWSFECQRPEIAPQHYLDQETLFGEEPTLVLAGGGKAYSNGLWTKTVSVKEGDFYQFKAFYQTVKVEEPLRSILARLIWLDEKGNLLLKPEYPALIYSTRDHDWSELEQVYQAPAMAIKAKIELIYRWDADGMVHFGGIALKPVDQPTPRMVRLATVHHRPQNSPSTRANLEEFGEFVRLAAQKDADIVCLPEGITLVGTKFNYVEVSEPIPGPSTDYLGQLASQLGLYIVAGILEKEDQVVYNTAVLLGPDGNIVGKYRKVSLPREEIEGGVTPGNELPVFDTSFGRIGMMICWDVTFPETARTLAQKGAEIIFLPIWGGDITLTRARAIENQIYLVSSTYDMKTAVFDKKGDILVEADDNNPVVVVEVDLNERELWPWLGDLKNRIPREMPSRKAIQTGQRLITHMLLMV